MKKNQQELDIADQTALISVIKTKIEVLQELSVAQPDLFQVEIQKFFCIYPINSNRDMVASIIKNHTWDVDLLAALIYKEIESNIKEA